MAITDKEEGVWNLDEVYNKINQGGIWDYDGSNTLYGWGLNNNGYVGDNSNVNRSSPTQISGTTWSELSNAHMYRDVSIAFKNNELYCWGNNDFGMLGQNDRTYRSSPTQIPGTWSAGAAIRKGVVAIKTDGTAWVWGNNEFGVLGLNKANDVDKKSSPTQLGTDSTWGTSRDKLSGGWFSAYAIKANGTFWSWGYNGDGQLANNDADNAYSSPIQIGTDTTWDKLCDNGHNYMGAIKTDGSLWTWGDGEYGQLGLNKGGDPAPRRQSSPCQVPGTWSSATFGNLGCLAVKTNGTLWVWGKNDEGELGQNQGPSQLNRVSSPTQIGTDTTWSASLAGGDLEQWAAVKTDGTLWTWGNQGNQGFLGLNDQGSTPRRSSPTQVPGTNWDKVSGGKFFHATQII